MAARGAAPVGAGWRTVEAACAAHPPAGPAARAGASARRRSQYVTPDVIVRKVRGQWTATLNEAVVPRVRLNRSYAELFRRHRNAEHGELGAHLQEARWTVRNVEQRFSTILARRAGHPQAAAALPGLRRDGDEAAGAARDRARRSGVHESTVSRVTNNKFMATPCGVFELKYFFSRGLATASGGECSPTAIRGADPGDRSRPKRRGQPLSDVEIARQLASQGLRWRAARSPSTGSC